MPPPIWGENYLDRRADPRIKFEDKRRTKGLVPLPLTIPAFVQYQSPMFPLRGLWNRAPQEGDQFVNVECDWLVSPPGNAVQFSLSGNSPVALSQIVALAVDNGRCGADVDFIFPDSGFVLTVPAHNQGVFPVFTNALMFYASAPSSAAGDITIFQILNSLPPPIPMAATETQNHSSVTAIALANGSTPIVAPGVSGTLNSLSITIALTGGFAALILADGRPVNIWGGTFDAAAATTQFFNPNLNGLNVRFVNGLNAILSGVTATGGPLDVNVYYTTP
jgi:hypothetical protein